MNYQEARIVFLENMNALLAAWGRKGREEDLIGKVEHQSIEALYEEIWEDGPKLGSPEWYELQDYETKIPEDCVAVLVHDIASYELFIPSSMTMEEFQEILTSEVLGFPAED